MHRDLSSNRFTGTVPAEFYQSDLTLLVAINNECIPGETAFHIYLDSRGRMVCAVHDLSKAIQATATSNLTYNDDVWHHIQCSRQGMNLQLYVDNVQVGNDTTGNGVVNLVVPACPYLGGLPCLNTPGAYTSFLGSMANLSTYVDLPPGSLCSVDAVTGTFVPSGYSQLVGCSRVLGICAPKKQGLQCCAVEGCDSCVSYTQCNSCASGLLVQLSIRYHVLRCPRLLP
jgi:hypothetical protein